MAANAVDALPRGPVAQEPASFDTPFMAASAIADKAKLFPIAAWAPRSGRGMQYQKWLMGVQRLGKAFGLTEGWIHSKTTVYPAL